MGECVCAYACVHTCTHLGRSSDSLAMKLHTLQKITVTSNWRYSTLMCYDFLSVFCTRHLTSPSYCSLFVLIKIHQLRIEVNLLDTKFSSHSCSASFASRLMKTCDDYFVYSRKKIMVLSFLSFWRTFRVAQILSYCPREPPVTYWYSFCKSSLWP